ncbi:MAG: 50S ribosomal protein L23 [Chromatiales bacterium]
MSPENLINVLVTPLISEKTARVAESGQYVFAVQPAANKQEVKAAVELMFKVEVASVQMCNLAGKTKAFRGKRGRRKGLRKAYVRLKPGFSIEFGAAP